MPETRAFVLHTIVLAATLTAGIALPASAQAPVAIESVYTPLDHSKPPCRSIDKEKVTDGYTVETWRCPGFSGIDVFVNHEDERDSIAYGRKGKALTEYHQLNTGGMNHIGNMLEWRVTRTPDGARLAFATIVRASFNSSDGDKERRVSTLMVTRLGKVGGDTCVIAYVDALKVADANLLARKVADARARDATRPCPAKDQIPYIDNETAL